MRRTFGIVALLTLWVTSASAYDSTYWARMGRLNLDSAEVYKHDSRQGSQRDLARDPRSRSMDIYSSEEEAQGFRRGWAAAEDEIQRKALTVYRLGGYRGSDGAYEATTALRYREVTGCVIRPGSFGFIMGHNARVAHYIEQYGLPDYTNKYLVDVFLNRHAIWDSLSLIQPPDEISSGQRSTRDTEHSHYAHFETACSKSHVSNISIDWRAIWDSLVSVRPPDVSSGERYSAGYIGEALDAHLGIAKMNRAVNALIDDTNRRCPRISVRSTNSANEDYEIPLPEDVTHVQVQWGPASGSWMLLKYRTVVRGEKVDWIIVFDLDTGRPFYCC